MNRTRIFSILWQPANLIRFAALLSIVVLVSGSDSNCKGSDSGGGGTSAPAVPGVTLSVTSPLPLELAPGGSGKVTVAVTRINGFSGPVPLTLYDPVSGSPCFSAAPVTVPADGSSADLTVQVSSACPTGARTRAFDVDVAQTTGYGPAHVEVAATVVAQGAFAISAASPASFPLPGETIHVTATIVRSGYTGSISIAIAAGGQYVTSATITQPGIGNTADLALVISPTAFRANSFSQQFTATGPGAPDQSFYVSGTTRGYDFTMSYSPQPVNVPQNGYSTIFLTFAQPTNPSPSANVMGTFTSTTAGLTGDATILGPPNGTAFSGRVFAAATVPVGDYTMTLTGKSTGVADQSIPVAVHVFASSYTYSIQMAPLTVPPGGTVPDPITITRNNMPDAVYFTGTADDPNIVITGAAATTGNTSSISVFVPNSTSLGTHNVTLHGVAPGHNDVVQTFAIVVQVPVINTTWTFCPTSGLPVSVAVQDGTGAWTPVTGTGNTYGFNISNATGGIAYVTQPGTTDLHIFYGTKAELQAQGAGICGNTGATKTITGTVSNTGTAAAGYIGLGSALAQLALPGSTAFQLNNVPPGTLDLVAATVDNVSPQPNALKMLLRRNVNLATGGSTGALDFTGAESVVPTIKTLTPSAFDQGVQVTYGFQTSNQVLSTYYSIFTSAGPTLKVFGVPAANQVAGDLHWIMAQAYSGTGSTTFNRIGAVAVTTIADMPVTIGSALLAPSTPTALATAPYVRMHVVLAVQPEYNKLFAVTYQQSFGSNRNVFIQMTGGYTGGTTGPTIDMPDFSGVAGWSNSWGPIAGFLTHWIVTASAWTNGGTGIVFPVLSPGTTFTSATRQGDVTP